MSQLFDVSTDNVGLHLKNIFEDGELSPEATTEESSVVQIEGSREVQRLVTLYNLDAILAVGYKNNRKDLPAFEKQMRRKTHYVIQPAHLWNSIATYQFRKEETRYSRRVEMDEIKKNDFNLNISRYISTAVGEAEIDLADTHRDLVEIEKAIEKATKKRNAFLKELKLPPLPGV